MQYNVFCGLRRKNQKLVDIVVFFNYTRLEVGFYGD